MVANGMGLYCAIPCNKQCRNILHDISLDQMSALPKVSRTDCYGYSSKHVSESRDVQIA